MRQNPEAFQSKANESHESLTKRQGQLAELLTKHANSISKTITNCQASVQGHRDVTEQLLKELRNSSRGQTTTGGETVVNSHPASRALQVETPFKTDDSPGSGDRPTEGAYAEEAPRLDFETIRSQNGEIFRQLEAMHAERRPKHSDEVGRLIVHLRDLHVEVIWPEEGTVMERNEMETHSTIDSTTLGGDPGMVRECQALGYKYYDFVKVKAQVVEVV